MGCQGGVIGRTFRTFGSGLGRAYDDESAAGGRKRAKLEGRTKYSRRRLNIAAMKPRTTGGEMEAVEASRKIVMRIPSDGGGRIVIELSKEEAAELGSLLVAVSS